MTVAASPALGLKFGDVLINVAGNDPQLIRRLSRYFEAFVASNRVGRPRDSLTLVEDSDYTAGLPWEPWDSRGKENFADIDSVRVVRKDRTGVTIEVSGRQWTMCGPLGRNFSQVVNVVSAMYGLRVLARGGAMVHSSYVARENAGIAIVGQSGADKSSVAVRLLELGFDFVSNDRLILERAGHGIMGSGLPKLPRVNPGTLLAGEATSRLFDDDTRRRYTALPREELWRIEDKYDLDVNATLGRRWLLSAPLACILFLDWRVGEVEVDVSLMRPELALKALRGVAKDFGPLDQMLMRRTDTALRETAERAPAFRVTGGADPGRLARLIAERRLPLLAPLV